MQRFLREIQISAQCNHPYLVRIFNVDSANGIPYIVMEYVDGLPLDQYSADKDLSEKLAVFVKLAQALAFAHGKNIVHRDVKPANILVRASGDPVLMDFGLAKTSQIGDKSLTRTGEVIGTPQYMSPEQARGLKRQIDHLTDIYALGAMLYHIIAGIPVVNGDSLVEMLRQIVDIKIKPPSKINKDLPKALDKICLKAMEKRKQRRYPDAQAFAEDLERFKRGETTLAQRYYFGRKMCYAALIAFVLAISAILAVLAPRCLRSNPSSQQSARTLITEIEALYRNGQAAEALENAYLCFSRIHDLLKDKSFVDQQRLHYRWHSKITIALVDNYYRQGQSKLVSSPEQARIYFSRAQEFLAQLPSELRLYHQWQSKLRLALIRALFNGGSYQRAYQLGQRLAKAEQNAEMASILARCAYYCNEDDALQRFITIEKSSDPSQDYYLEALYYQGMIHWNRKQFGRAGKLFAKILPLLRQQRNYPFRAALYLRYCALLLADFHLVPDRKRLAEIGAYLPQIAGEFANDNLYRETLSRYYLALLESNNLPPGISVPQLAQKMLNLIEPCLKDDRQKADYYYIRGKAKFYLRAYAQAQDDFLWAADLEPAKPYAFLAQYRLLAYYVDPEKLQDYDLRFKKYIYSTLYSFPDLFLKDFSTLRKRYLGLRFASGIAFSTNKLNKFYANLGSPSLEIRQLAKETIAAMVPPQQVVAALKQRRAKASREQHQIITRLIQLIKHRAQSRQRQQLLYRLSTVTAQGHVSRQALRYFKGHGAFLIEVLQNDKGDGSGQNWLLLRFLAARVLAASRNIKTREALINNFLENDHAAIVPHILVAKALHDIGLTFFAPTRLYKYTGQSGGDEFLQALIASILKPHTRKTTLALIRLLGNASVRVRLLAIQNLASNPPNWCTRKW